eukprot:4945052-Pleurochrysis_carterae.AAC.8
MLAYGMRHTPARRDGQSVSNKETHDAWDMSLLLAGLSAAYLYDELQLPLYVAREDTPFDFGSDAVLNADKDAVIPAQSK